MLKTLLLVAAGAIAALLAYAATRPDIFRISRSTRVQAPPERVFALINDMGAFNTWNPYNAKDPQIQGTYRGPQAGAGAAYDFSGNREVGRGTIAITGSEAPGQVRMQLDMTAPMRASNQIEFTLAPQGDATEVTWSMHGPCPFIGKLMGVVFDMDRMVGRDFEAGLATLKARAERA
jgi:uncharacterized protein YndB with AHSA1/START domain